MLNLRVEIGGQGLTVQFLRVVPETLEWTLYSILEKRCIEVWSAVELLGNR